MATLPDLQQQLAQLRAENDALRRATTQSIRLKVSEKGALSVYGMGRFPVTLYKEQWLKLLSMGDQMKAFITANSKTLKSKDQGTAIV
jgi:hypothetical protein